MSPEPNDIFGDEQDSWELGETARALADTRPVPSPGFRGELGRLLRAMGLLRPVRHLRLKALALAAGGALLLALAGAGVAGSGPLAPGQGAAAPISSAASSR